GLPLEAGAGIHRRRRHHCLSVRSPRLDTLATEASCYLNLVATQQIQQAASAVSKHALGTWPAPGQPCEFTAMAVTGIDLISFGTVALGTVECGQALPCVRTAGVDGASALQDGSSLI